MFGCLLLLSVILSDDQFIVTDRPLVITDRPAAGPATVEQSANDIGAEVVPVAGLRLQYWGASWCGYCPAAKLEAEKAAKELGVKLEVFDWDRHAEVRRRVRVTSVPTIFIVRDDKISFASEGKFVGRVSASRIVERARGGKTVTKTRTVTRTSSIYNGDPGSSHESRGSLISHLLSDGIHAGRHTRAELDAMTDQALSDLHDAEHNAATGRAPQWVRPGISTTTTRTRSRGLFFDWR